MAVSPVRATTPLATLFRNPIKMLMPMTRYTMVYTLDNPVVGISSPLPTVVRVMRLKTAASSTLHPSTLR